MSDRYEIREKLGQGGLGAVYKAYDKQLKREVALKRVITPTQQAIEDLLREATALSSLMHPNIVTVFDVGQDAEGGFVVMELLDGETLDDTISRAPLTLPDFAEVVNQTLEALIAAQAVNMTHRDLKPSNIMVIWRPSGRFQIKVLDFGLAKISAAPTPQTSDQEEGIMGSIYFMAPEQFERATLDFRTDMYAMGCIYYYCLTALYPFDGETAPQVMMAHLHHLVRPLEVVRPDIPEEVADWVMWLMERNREDRPGTAREALDRFPDLTRPTPVISGAIPRDGTVRASPAPPLVGEVAARPATPPAQKGAPTHSLRPVGPRPPGSHRGGALRTGGKQGQKDKRGASAATGAVPAAEVMVADKEEKPRIDRTKLIFILASCVSVLLVAGIGSVLFAGKAQRAKETARVEALDKAPQGSGGDVPLLLRNLNRDPAANGARVRRILTKLRGNGVDDELRKQLAKPNPAPARLALLEAVESRGLTGTFAPVADLYRKSNSPEERSKAITALVRIAAAGDVGGLLGILKTTGLTAADRKLLEDGVCSLLYRNADVVERLQPVLNELPASSGDQRKSLARISGILGSEAILDRFLAKLLSNSPEDLILALNHWPDRSCKDLLESYMTGIGQSSKVAASKAYIRMLQLPTADPDDTAAYKLVLSAADPGDVERIFDLMVSNPSPPTLKFCQTAKLKGLESPLIQTEARVQKKIKEALVIKSGQLVPAAQAAILGGEDGTQFVKASEQIDWKTPRSWMVWVVRVEAPGTYEVSVVGSCPDNEGSEVQVTFAGDPLKAPTRKTAAGKTSETLNLGELTIDASRQGVRRLFLSAGSVAQPPAIMQVKGLRFTRKP